MCHRDELQPGAYMKDTETAKLYEVATEPGRETRLIDGHSTDMSRLRKALAERREELKWELVPEGGEGEPGTQWSTLISPEHSTRPCKCGGTQRVLNAMQRIDVGVNRGVVTLLSTAKCDTCGTGMSSNYRRV